MALHAISLCAGHAGIDLGTSLACELSGVEFRTVCYVERESYAACALVARMEDAHLEQAPVYSDITTFDGRRWRGCVDIVLAGFPCQPFSVAGRRAGTEDERHLWPHVLRIFRESGARWLLLENVPGLISTRTLQHRSDLIAHLDLLDAAGQRAPRPRDRWKLQEHRDRLYGRLLREHGISALHYVLCGLEGIGAKNAWGLFSAEEVGAPHERLRVFILAELAECAGAPVPNTSQQGLQGGERPGASGERDGATAYGPAPELHRALFPPPPNDLDGWIEYLRNAPGLEPAVRRGAHGLAHRLDELRGCGNGVLPIVAAYAFICLVCDLHARREGGVMKEELERALAEVAA